MRPLRELLNPGERFVVFTGGGGKTALMRALARQLAGWGERTLMVARQGARPPARNLLLLDERPAPAVYTQLSLARSLDPATGLLRAVEPGEIPGLAERFGAHRVLVELGDSGGMPLAAAPAEGLPPWTEAVFGVTGLDALGLPLAQAAADPESLGPLLGLSPDDPVDAQALRLLAVHPLGLFRGAPAGARRIAFGNKADRHAPSGGLAGSALLGWFLSRPGD